MLDPDLLTSAPYELGDAVGNDECVQPNSMSRANFATAHRWLVTSVSSFIQRVFAC
jgi:hypothetical protein